MCYATPCNATTGTCNAGPIITSICEYKTGARTCPHPQCEHNASICTAQKHTSAMRMQYATIWNANTSEASFQCNVSTSNAPLSAMQKPAIHKRRPCEQGLCEEGAFGQCASQQRGPSSSEDGSGTPKVSAGCCAQWLICLFPMTSGLICSQRRRVQLLAGL